MSIIKSIKEFNELAGNTTDRFNARQAALYAGLILEEVSELMLAIGLPDLAHELEEYSDEFKAGGMTILIESNDGEEMQTAILDACCDLTVVSAGLALSIGADIEGALQEVCRSNDSKSVYRDVEIDANECTSFIKRMKTLEKDANGKILKGYGYTPPDLAPYLAK